MEDIVDIIREDGRWEVVEGKDEVLKLIKMMEEMAGKDPKEYGKREPGERQAREIYREREMGSELYGPVREETSNLQTL